MIVLRYILWFLIGLTAAIFSALPLFPAQSVWFIPAVIVGIPIFTFVLMFTIPFILLFFEVLSMGIVACSEFVMILLYGPND